ncbi:N-acetylmuramoyl-L-alanine amidase family protein [Flagellimonas sp.]|uniref:N-acetylmuramoyl-L-alanine amidase family protein n=1 Tax=Flagellimonas sp. TaxID=2058762 RepID=UPI003B504939
MAQDSIQHVKAEEGDGIYSLLRRHGLDPGKFYEDFVQLNNANLGDDFQLYVGKSYQIPQAIEQNEIPEVFSQNYPIFGKDYATVPSISNRLDKTVYYLISGHGGPDPGAVENHGGKKISEDEYAYDVTLRLARELLSHGAEVHIIVQDENDGIRDERILNLDTDEVVFPNKAIPLRQVERLSQRVEAVNRLYLKHKGRYQRLIVTHVDSRSKGTNIDVFFYHHHKSKNGKRLAENIHKTFQKKYKKFQPNRKYTGTFKDRSNLYLVKNTLPAIAYIEIGNIRNKKDQRRILDPDNRQALAKWISEGILLDFETRPGQ